MSANVMSMEDIWRKACLHFDVPEPVAKLWYERIYERLNEDNPRRIYHNWNEMMLHKQPYLQHYKPTVVIAAFFQYYEFQGNRCCEGEICETFRQFWKDAEVDDEDAKHLILNLLGNKSLSTHPLYPMESELLQDLDLVILGAPAEDYKRYKDLLRREFAHLADEDYVSLRMKNSNEQPSTSGRQPLQNPSTPRKLKPHEKLLKYLKSQQTNKTIRSIKKRCRPHLCPHPASVVQLNRNRLNFMLNKTPDPVVAAPKRLQLAPATSSPDKPKKFVKTKDTRRKNHGTLEEGEIVTDDDNDDCMIIETPIISIVIDDDTPIKPIRRKVDEPNPLASSTLLNSSMSDAEDTSFFIDTTGGFCKQNSAANVLYNKRLAPLGLKPLRRSRRRLKNVTNTSDISASEPSNWAEVIDLDETTPHGQSTIKPAPSEDSVICLGDVSSGEALNFIPLGEANSPKRVRSPEKSKTPFQKQLINNNSLFSKSEKKELKAYNSNAYNPDADAQNQKKGSKRIVIIDGCNVAMQHARNKDFSVKGLKIVIEHFENQGHEVKGVIPRFRLHKCTDPPEMQRLHDEGKIVVTPCKNVNGKTMSSYDDRFVLQLAGELDGAIVSNDNYRDLINENTAFKKIVENRVIGFTWCNDLFMVPKDPYGRWGPSLHTILHR